MSHEPQIDDIICYFDVSGANMHSGIVTEVYGTSPSSGKIADNVMVRSKWGYWGLYEHNGEVCPYVSAYGGDADYVMYFRPHDYSTFLTRKSNVYHGYACTECGYFDPGSL